MIRAGADTGGTFTDVAVLRDGALAVGKLPTTPADPSLACAAGVADQVTDGEAVAILGHGTTIATNALLEGALARVALVTTAGFRDVVEIGRQKRLGLYDLDPRTPPAPVPRELRFEVRERLAADGSVVEPLDAGALGALGDALARAQVAGVAIGFLHAYANPAHEIEVETWLRERFGDDLVVCRSSAVLPEFREHERFSSTALNAALTPVVGPYVGRLRERLPRGVRTLLITQSDGTLLPAQELAALPIRSVLSGPSSGVVAARAVMAAAGLEDYVTLDMGGTSTDICAVQAGEPLRRAEVSVGGHLVRTPALDIHTIGAGGGSIAFVDDGGHLQVGPRSAGADPGPAAYGHGGAEPTVTDACAVLGWLRDGRELPGAITLDRAAAVRALEPVAAALGVGLEAAAEGVLAIEAAGIERAVRTLVAGRGIDLREGALCVFGGAGPMVASPVARALGVREVVIPPHPGLLCAIGLLAADGSRVFAATRRVALDEDGFAAGCAVLDELAEQGRAWATEAGLGDADALTLAEEVDVRYRGQNFELPVGLGPPRPRDAAALRAAFEARHRSLYRFTLDRPVELVTWRVTASVALPGWSPGGAAREPGEVFTGPESIEEMDTTIVLAAGDHARVDDLGNLRITW